MSAIESALKAAIYASPIARQAVYTDASGDEIDVHVLREEASDTLLEGAELGVRGPRVVFYALRSEIANRPQRGEGLTVDGTCYRIDEDAAERGLLEWVIYGTT